MPVLTIPTESRLTVLLADDDDNDLLLIRRAAKEFKSVGRLVCVSSGEEVLDYLERSLGKEDRQACPVPDVVVLDQFMPRWSGLDVLLWVRSSPRFARLPVVILSLGLAPAQVDEAGLLRAAYCPKTQDLENLPAAIYQAARMIQLTTSAMTNTMSAGS